MTTISPSQPLDNPQSKAQHHQQRNSSKTGSRRQHRSCDQCRKGKRACDAAALGIPVDLASSSLSSSSIGPVTWPESGSTHGSSNLDGCADTEGGEETGASTVVRCSNCTKTGKTCTFEWLRSTQEIAWRRRKRGGVDEQTHDQSEELSASINGSQGLDASISNNSPASSRRFSQDTTFAPSTIFEYMSETMNGAVPIRNSFPTINVPYLNNAAEVSMESFRPQESGSYPVAQNLDISTDVCESNFRVWEAMDRTDQNSSEPQSSDLMPNTYTTNTVAKDAYTKRTRRSRKLNGARPAGPQPLANRKHSTFNSSNSDSRKWPSDKSMNGRIRDHLNPSSDILQQLTRSTNRSYLTENLVRVYHDSMENALSCWLTERTCPYSANSDSFVPAMAFGTQDSMSDEWGPNWSNRICTRVCHLDRVSLNIRDRPLTRSEDRAASRALHAAIMSFATQWAQSNRRSMSNFSSFMATESDNKFGSNTAVGPGYSYGEASSLHVDDAETSLAGGFDRTIQESCWYRARQALQESAGIESFRVIFAHIIFALTQKPLDVDEHAQTLKERRHHVSISSNDTFPSNSRQHGENSSHSLFLNSIGVSSIIPSHDPAPSKSTDLNEIIGFEGPPIFLETALRQIFSFRCKLESIERQRAKRNEKLENGNGVDYIAEIPIRADPLSVGDRKTFNLLFWLAVMFDTLSAAMNERPLVVSDEDSDIIQGFSWDVSGYSQSGSGQDNFSNASACYDSMFAERPPNLWGKFLLEQKQLRHRQYIPKWPCSYEDAAATLCDAAPIKVLFFRKVTHLQTLLSRRARYEKLEEAINDALKVYQRWNDTYGGFILDCIANHDNLPPRIQSWYVVLAGHWHLAGILLADKIEAIDESKMGLESQRGLRQSAMLVQQLRRQNAFAISDLGRCACPRYDSSFPEGREFHFALNKGPLLTEPWTVVLIRAFGKAGYIMLEWTSANNQSKLNGLPVEATEEFEQARERCELCIQALWYLGRKSDMALLAAIALSSSLKDRSTPSPPPSSSGAFSYVNLDRDDSAFWQYTLPNFDDSEMAQLPLPVIPEDIFYQEVIM